MVTSKEGQKIVLVTGPSGAGRITAIRSLEDLGFEAIDNLPLGLIRPLLISQPDAAAPVAIGVDVRTRGFNSSAMLDVLYWMRKEPRLDPVLLYLDCHEDVLLRRFSETRRKHPLAHEDTPSEGISLEIQALEPLRQHADMLIDTSDLSPHDLKAELGKLFGRGAGPTMSISLESFSYKRGTPSGLDMALDCRFLRNPHWDERLRPLTGLDPAVAAYVQEDSRHAQFMDQTIELLKLLLPAYVEEGKAYFTLGFGCTGGKHRSVYMANEVSKRLAQMGWPVTVRHRELERRQV
ncbi:UPF0042 nucleotide-binding protein [Rubricella aquisinus]|uniref:UPF0042 nucleotide-binding protein n=1 Tax=Rubricella aquisinus TaxID=2028108 RepID=A0A840WLA8_9RHOB|nr:RNase adapter RapZ [Rubricella aquisinus]MBB5515311.1 UPF0042 nucleotide-binding protein [Rubricella aquisinus]